VERIAKLSVSRADKIAEAAVKKLFGAFAAAIVALVLFTPPAEARCWWNGYRWHCTPHYHHYVGYPYYGYGYYPYYYRPYYACVFPFCW
jgi:hypothetical protein